jgi:outer membrane protein
MFKFALTTFAIASLALYACGDKKSTAEKGDTTPKVEAVNLKGLKIAFYYQDSLKTQFEFYRFEDSIVTEKQKVFQREVERQTKDFQDFIARNETRAKSGMLSQNEVMQIQQTAQQKEGGLMQYQQQEGGKLEKETFIRLEAIGKKIEVFSKEFCEKNNIDILVVHAKGGQFNYINEKMDVTKEFTNFLNESQEDIQKDIKK